MEKHWDKVPALSHFQELAGSSRMKGQPMIGTMQHFNVISANTIKRAIETVGWQQNSGWKISGRSTGCALGIGAPQCFYNNWQSDFFISKAALMQREKDTSYPYIFP
jgi:hypothetical protein